MKFRHVYGPVPSRRLGRSLGVDPIPFKACTYNCVYCQLGRTSPLTDRRQRFFPPGEVLQEIQEGLILHPDELDYVTFVGEGEPTLCQDLGALIGATKKMTSLPVAVITNGSLLYRNDVREELAQADVVMPSLNAADRKTWHQVNRPHGRLDSNAIIEGVIHFRSRFQGQLWMEVMLVGGIHDGEESLLAIRQALERIKPDRIFVNAPIRPPAESWVKPPDAEGWVRAHVLLGEGIFIDGPEEGTFDTAGFDRPLDAVMAIVRRHPMRRDQILETLEPYPIDGVEAALDELVTSNKMRLVVYRDDTYYVAGEGWYMEKM
jgi:wyosine [tRNA(Phe)-imidazoG37] synthetase (radical SAM superfamily)